MSNKKNFVESLHTANTGPWILVVETSIKQETDSQLSGSEQGIVSQVALKPSLIQTFSDGGSYSRWIPCGCS